MMPLYRRIFDLLLPEHKKEKWLVTLPRTAQGTEGAREITGQYYIPSAIYPDGDMVEMSEGEQFVASLEHVISERLPHWVFMIPPWVPSKMLSAELQQKYPHQGLEAITIMTVLRMLPPESILAALVPSSLLLSERSRRARAAVLNGGDVEEKYDTGEQCGTGLWLVITHDHPLSFFGFKSIHHSFRASTVVFRKSRDMTSLVRFFKYPWVEDAAEQDQILEDLSRLLRQEGGRTCYGYVLREGLAPGSKWSFDLYSPETKQKREKLQMLGEVKPLKELFDIIRGVHVARRGKEVQSQPAPDHVPLLSGKCISPTGYVQLEEILRYVRREGSVILKNGDICVRRIARDTVVAAIVTTDLPTCAFDDTILVLRPKAALPPEQQEFYLAYLKSPVAWHFLSTKGISLHVDTANLGWFPMPRPNADILEALHDLSRADDFMHLWRDEIEQAKGDLFNFATAYESRPQILSVGRRCRQRVAAGIQVDRLAYRIRTQYPHPLAFRWRTVEASIPDTEGYDGLLECAEVAAFFMAALSISVVCANGERIGYLEDMASRITSFGRGTNFGDWIAVLIEARDSKRIKKLSEQVPFVEVLRFLDGSDACESLRDLKKARDDRSHLRGPKGAAMARAFDEQLKNLETLYSAMEFLTDYSLIAVEDVRPDTLRHVTEYSYRDLKGDHALVPVRHDGMTEAAIEKGSLYLCGKKDQLLLLRPLLQRVECPVCRNISTFYLDSYDKKTGICSLKSMEHGHPLTDKSIASPLKQVGLLR